MRRYLTPLGFGLLFGMGLVVSGMIDTANVKGFLDISGAWRPGLGLVMGGAVLVALPIFQWVNRRGQALDGTPVEPPSRLIDIRLIGGAALFGIGWGIAGICPGPALVWLGIDPLAILPFIAALITGNLIADLGLKALKR
ncbi:MAG: YeeE/YedE family protein [Asticcacaulis sp.]|uniref:DUF6691 family protein n=1 Tax=Asticcacaulis sp. TaxID=1872648 RepID=UPI0039E622BC